MTVHRTFGEPPVDAAKQGSPHERSPVCASNPCRSNTRHRVCIPEMSHSRSIRVILDGLSSAEAFSEGFSDEGQQVGTVKRISTNYVNQEGASALICSMQRSDLHIPSFVEWVRESPSQLQTAADSTSHQVDGVN